jgi:peptidyl-tRNA hydrolase, PTH1 family
MGGLEQNPVNDEVPLTTLIVGLGNPGREYADNRHNVGFKVIDCICKDLGTRLNRIQSKALIGRAMIGDEKIILAKPHTFMNLSGQSVSGLMRFYRIPEAQILIIHDDLDLPLGVLRLRASGGSAGQKGLASVIERLGTENFPRLRIGVGRPPGRMDAVDYVLQNFSSSEQEILSIVLDKACQAARIFATEGIERAMNQFNGPVEREQ